MADVSNVELNEEAGCHTHTHTMVQKEGEEETEKNHPKKNEQTHDWSQRQAGRERERKMVLAMVFSAPLYDLTQKKCTSWIKIDLGILNAAPHAN